MDSALLRAWWSHRQGLDGRLQGASPDEVLASTGWARSVGGANPYLTLFARAGSSRADAEHALATTQIHELPSARGCTYVVPAADFALALTVGQGYGDESKTARKLGVTDKEIETLCRAVTDALATQEMDPDALRQAAGSAVRHLGAEGQKKGLTTTLPVALGLLQARGDIRRVPTNGRLDQQRYRYALWRPNPLAGSPLGPEEAYTELARRFFAWAGPATLAEFQWFSALGVKASKAAIDPLGLVALENGSPRLMLPADRDAFLSFKAPREPHYTLVAGLDGISHLRRDVTGLLASEDAARTVAVEGGTRQTSGLIDLPNHAILDRGRLIGLWEYDVDTTSIVWSSFVPRTKALQAAVARTEAFVRDELGDARSFSLDSPKSRAWRIAALR